MTPISTQLYLNVKKKDPAFVTSLLSPCAGPHFPDSNSLIHVSEMFCASFSLLSAVPSPRFIGHPSARRPPPRLSPRLATSEPGENHTAPCCPQASAARWHWSRSRQADNTLVLCQQLNTEIRHGQRRTTIDPTDWSGAHSWLWHRPTARYWIAVFPPPDHLSLQSQGP